VRTTGPVDPLTQQPVKGRKKHGGVRFGEMERDALISHGTPFLLQDRLFNNLEKTLVGEMYYHKFIYWNAMICLDKIEKTHMILAFLLTIPKFSMLL